MSYKSLWLKILVNIIKKLPFLKTQNQYYEFQPTLEESPEERGVELFLFAAPVLASPRWVIFAAIFGAASADDANALFSSRESIRSPSPT